MRKGLGIGLAICLVMSTSAYAVSDQSVPVTLDSEATTFSVTVPTSLPVWVDKDGVITVADNASIINNSTGPIEVKGIDIKGTNGWEVLDYSADTTGISVGSKKAGFIINGDTTTSSGMNFTQSNWPSINGGQSTTLDYNANIAPQDKAIQQEIATVTFTIGWSSPEKIEYTPFTVTDSNRHMVGYTGEPGENLVIPSTFQGEDGVYYEVVEIGDAAFFQCENLESLVIPDSVVSLGSSFAKNCISLKSVKLPNNITLIPSGSFWGSGIISVDIPDSVTEIGSSAFHVCTNLKEVKLSANLETIGHYPFYKTAIEEIDIPDSVRVIGRQAFELCQSLTRVHIGKGVERINAGAFMGCSNIEELLVPDTVTIIEDYAFGQDGYGYVKHITYHGPAKGAPWGALSMN